MWSDEIVPIVRYLINDTGSPPNYQDSSIEEIIVIATQLMKFEISFDVCYSVSIANATITPDPTSVSLPDGQTRDDAFIKLSALKSAIIILQAQLQSYAVSAVRIVDGPSTVDTTSIVKAVQVALDNAKEQYEEARLQYQAGARTGFAITQFDVRRELPSLSNEFWR